MIDYLGDIGQELRRAEPARLQALHEALGVEMTYYPEGRTVEVTIRLGRVSPIFRGWSLTMAG